MERSQSGLGKQIPASLPAAGVSRSRAFLGIRAPWIRRGVALLLSLVIVNLVWVLWKRVQPYLVDVPDGFPRVMLWVWERPENLESIDPSEVGVAILAKTLIIEKDRLVVRPRMQPVAFPERSRALAVVRIEARPGVLAISKSELRQELVREIVELAGISAVSGIQVDFDAKTSERAFYREMLVDLRSQLPSNLRLSITALASWCIHDDWISTLPIDEAVPMLFRLGIAHEDVTRYLAAGNDFRSVMCRCSVGVSTGEFPARLPPGRRIYVFPERRWTDASLSETLKRIKERQ